MSTICSKRTIVVSVVKRHFFVILPPSGAGQTFVAPWLVRLARPLSMFANKLHKIALTPMFNIRVYYWEDCIPSRSSRKAQDPQTSSICDSALIVGALRELQQHIVEGRWVGATFDGQEVNQPGQDSPKTEEARRRGNGTALAPLPVFWGNNYSETFSIRTSL